MQALPVKPVQDITTSTSISTYQTFNPEPWAKLASSTGSLYDSKKRTLTIELREGVLCTVTTPQKTNAFDFNPQSFTMTCIRPDAKEIK